MRTPPGLLVPITVSCASIALSAATGRAAGGEGWPGFRGPGGQGRSTATDVPSRWSATSGSGIDWRVEVPGRGWSSPVVSGGRVILTTAVPGDRNASEQSLHVVSFDTASGDVVWDREVHRHGRARIHSKNSHASPTPIVAGDRIWVHFGTHVTACLDRSGEVVWMNTSLEYDPVHGSGGSPALAESSIIIVCDGSDRQFVVALDRETGEERWRTPRPPIDGKGFSFGTPLVLRAGGREQAVCPGPGRVVSYDPDDGEEIWRVEYPGGYSVVPRPVFGHGLVFVSTGYDTPSLLAIRPDGEGDVTDSHVAWRRRRGVPLNPSPLLVGDHLYTVSDRGIASCLDARTGEQLWQERIGGDHSASPFEAEGRVYFLSEDGETTVIEASPEFEVVARNPLGERCLASAAPVDGALFVRGERHLWRIERAIDDAPASPGSSGADEAADRPR